MTGALSTTFVDFARNRRLSLDRGNPLLLPVPFSSALAILAASLVRLGPPNYSGQFDTVTAQECAILLQTAHYVNCSSDANLPERPKLDSKGDDGTGDSVKSFCCARRTVTWMASADLEVRGATRGIV